MDDALNSDLYLDGVVTVVDAKNVLKVRAPTDRRRCTTALAANGVHDRRRVPAPVQHLTAAPVEASIMPGLNEAVRQIALADRLIVNKVDTVDAATLAEVDAALRRVNAAAPIFKTSHSRYAPANDNAARLTDR